MHPGQIDSITVDMTIGEIFSLFPQKAQKLAHTLTLAGLNCSSCSAATWETLEAGMLGHGFDQEEMGKLVAQLNQILTEQEDLSTISLTERAAKKFIDFAKEEGLPEANLRFGDQAGGCGGFEYLLDFALSPEDTDLVFESHSVQIFVDEKIAPRLMGSVIDYVDGLQGAGFKVSNPQVRSSCGCGKSQGY